MHINTSILLLLCIAIFVAVFFCSCSFMNKPYTRELAKINEKTCTDLKMKYDMDCVGMGLGLDESNEKIATIYIRFKIKKVAKIDEARTIAIDALNIMYANVTQNETFILLHAEPGFNESNINMSIYFRGTENETVVDPYIGVVSMGNDKVSLRTNDPMNTDLYKTEITETLEEAQERVLR